MSLEVDTQPQPKLNIAIVGAGVAGLTTAISLLSHGHDTHNITVYERYPECRPIGGPVGIGPNASRYLIQLGLGESIEKCNPKLSSVLNQYRYEDGTRMRSVPVTNMTGAFGAPFWTISRYQLIRILLDRAIALGVVVKWNMKIHDVNVGTKQPEIIGEDGITCRYDLLIGADGIQSEVRAAVLGRKIEPKVALTCYNLNIPRSRLSADPELEFFLGQAGGWCGPGRCIVIMDMPDYDDSFNMCFCNEVGNGEEGEWFIKGDIRSVQAQFFDFESRVQKLLRLADPDACYQWRLSDIPALETWQSKTSRIVLIGDAAHAILPFAGMGVGAAVEDAMCLAECLRKVRSSAVDTDLRRALDAFEEIRKPRTAFNAEIGRDGMRMAHLPDGPEQEARDSFLRGEKMPSSQPTVEDELPKHEFSEFEPPLDSQSLYTTKGRYYLMAYEVLKHTKKYLAGQDWSKEVNSPINIIEGSS